MCHVLDHARPSAGRPLEQLADAPTQLEDDVASFVAVPGGVFPSRDPFPEPEVERAVTWLRLHQPETSGVPDLTDATTSDTPVRGLIQWVPCSGLAFDPGTVATR